MKITVINESQTRLLIAQKGFNLRSFSEMISISPPYLSQVLNGKRNPSPVVAKKIAGGLGESMEDIFFVNNGNKATND